MNFCKSSPAARLLFRFVSFRPYWLIFQHFLSNAWRKSSYVKCCSDEENDEDLDSIYYLPVAPEVDDPEETGWTQEVC